MTDEEFWNLCDVRLPTVDDPDPCYVFMGGSTGKDGRYGCADRDTAHRRAYRMCVGEIPRATGLGPYVKNVRCVNPAIFGVTHRKTCFCRIRIGQQPIERVLG